MLMKWARMLAGVVIGMVVVTMLAEAMEFATVTVANGGFTTDPPVYFGLRNRPSIITFSLFYKTVAGVSGGFMAAWIARQKKLLVGISLAALQAATLLWA